MDVLMELFTNFYEVIKTYIFTPIMNIGFIDALDILILSVVLFYLYQFMKDRRAGKLALGFVLILVALVLSIVLDMHAIKYILLNFYQVGIIAIIIVFQPELRAALEKVGATPLTGLRNIAGDSKDMAILNEAVSAICEASVELSRGRTGALIVIERTTKLGEYIKSGVTINANTTSYLFRNIFFNKAPLHDGAVIIRNMRIHAAGCFLPLSTKEDIVKDLGTRHRAAIGISEISDAVVVVVSEETGVISIACEGTLKRHYNYSSLKQELISLLTATNSNMTKKGHKAMAKKQGGNNE